MNNANDRDSSNWNSYHSHFKIYDQLWCQLPNKKRLFIFLFKRTIASG